MVQSLLIAEGNAKGVVVALVPVFGKIVIGGGPSRRARHQSLANPLAIQVSMASLHRRPHHSLPFKSGDSQKDQLAAENAGIASILVNWGFTNHLNNNITTIDKLEVELKKYF